MADITNIQKNIVLEMLKWSSQESKYVDILRTITPETLRIFVQDNHIPTLKQLQHAMGLAIAMSKFAEKKGIEFKIPDKRFNNTTITKKYIDMAMNYCFNNSIKYSPVSLEYLKTIGWVSPLHEGKFENLQQTSEITQATRPF